MGILDSLVFRLHDGQVSSDWEGIKPNSFPPEELFLLSVDSNGNNLSRYGDDSWDFRAFGGAILHFGDYSDVNKKLFKQIMFVFIYHHALFSGAYISHTSIYNILQRFLTVCESNRTRLDELHRFPNLIEKIAKHISPSGFGTSITKFRRLLSIKDELGFVVLDEQGLKLYASLNPSYEYGQTPVIPPRIWNHFINKSDEVLDDFLKYESLIKEAFNWLELAYKHNQTIGLSTRYLSPFYARYLYKSKRKLYKGDFEKFIDDFGLIELFNRHVSPNMHIRNSPTSFGVSSFSKLLTIGREIAFYYIQAYTLMRESETKYVRCNGLHIDEDDKYGKLYIVESKTTKTEDDPEALFPTSSSVEKAFKVAGFIAKLRMQFAPTDTPKNLLNNPYISTRAYEPWSSDAGSSFEPASKYSFVNKDSLFMDDDKFKISEEDYKFAAALTPSLLLEREKNKWFKVGNYWKFSDHQFRRTLAVQMNDFGVSKGTVQYCMKHRTQQMQNHYTKNATKILTNNLANKFFLEERIHQIYIKLADVVMNETDRYIKPYEKVKSIPVEVVKLIEESNFKKLYNEIKAGKTGIRLNLLGVCAKNGICEYGGIESISPCMGQHNSSGRPCSDLVLDKMNIGDIQKYIKHCQYQQKLFEKDSPVYQAMSKEIAAGNEAINRMQS